MPRKNQAAYHRDYRSRNRDKVNAWSNAYYKAHPGSSREYKWRKQGICLLWEQFLEMLTNQNYHCKICSRAIDTSAHVDHKHGSCEPRGALCSACNKVLGFASEDVSVLRAAIEYLVA